MAAALIFLLALGMRLGAVAGSRGGFTGIDGYDSGVYYAAADALLSGRLPYADFVLLHPPGVMLAVTPFAALGRLTSDQAGFLVATLAFICLGAVNAVLVHQIARRLGLSGVAAALGGIFYAIWYGAVDADVAIRLEPLGTFLFLCALLLLADESRLGRRRQLLAGAALGAACMVKIWWIVPLVLVLAWRLRAADTRPSAKVIAAGALAGGVVVAGPFLALAPGPMWRMVVVDQLSRAAFAPLPVRLRALTTLSWAFPRLSGTAEFVALGVLAALFAALCVRAWRVPGCRLIVLVAGAQLLVLVTGPSFFPFYDAYAAGAIALVVAGAAGAAGAPARRTQRAGRFGPALAGLAVVVTASLSAVTVLARPDGLVLPFPGQRLASGVAHLRCVMTDSPIALIDLNALTRDLVNGCPNWVDVTGRTYGVDAAPSAHISRPDNRRWQSDLQRYLLSGNAVILVRRGTGLSSATLRMIDSEPVLESARGYVVRAGRQR